MSDSNKLLVVGLVTEGEMADGELDPFEDYQELSVYELEIRFLTGRTIPPQTMVFITTQSELSELLKTIEGKGVELEVTTDDLGRPQPENLEDLKALLPKSDLDIGGGNNSEDLFNIL